MDNKLEKLIQGLILKETKDIKKELKDIQKIQLEQTKYLIELQSETNKLLKTLINNIGVNFND